MEKKIKTLYILSIIAIMAFLGMQTYWLYARLSYSLQEYEIHAQEVIEKTLAEYNRLRLQSSPKEKQIKTIHTVNNLNTDIDSTGMQRRTATISSKVFDGRELLGIKEDRKLTKDEMDRLATLVNDSLANIDEIKASFDATSAPSDGASWNAMRNFELEVQSPFSAGGIDSLLRKENIVATITLIETDSMIWESTMTPHQSIINPHFIITSPYSELEKKSVVIDCEIPSSEVLREMGWTLTLALVLSLFLILCLVWQIKTIVKLTRLDKMRNMFITTMIHELKRPISTLKICVSGIENEKMLSDKEMKAELISETRTALDSLSAYFSRLRDITFNDVEQIPLNVSKFNLNGLVDDVLSSASVPSNKSVRFENRVDANIDVAADRSHVFNIINNLVENAIKYSGEVVDIKIEAEECDGNMRIIVSDTGFGIPDSDQSKIFTRFYRGKASATEIPGIGLGLTYVKLLTEAHGGHITVKSVLGEGTSFIINLPQ